ncbi:hypothetical protein ACVRW7_01140 [Streptococcus ratti]|uniref:Immunity protein, BLpL-like n=1 Tax=Streptococcus ratti FA-1 = DSM 20564 TaxID=699248 RepID=A0ABP2QXJ8_STRRT|nr:hypothetical protein [Streptococcus ratti]EJN93785.1 putative immunity protein, BLpL-like [Streptococcus ratti FA-1 = DSM 20564]EMP70747.1 putative immunity protein, BLpL-like protein [Streptococcus ratti FA-1 = DSM 20564]QEY07638.1 hypothetical protein FY406_08290 [Streptococcus ratti]VEI60097.1 immunity protein, BLpL-like protein [Streptococcus mutans]
MFEKESQKLKLLRLLTAQLIAVCLLIMLLTQAIFKSPLLVQICFLIITFCTAALNYYFVKEIRKAAPKETSVSAVAHQLIFAAVFLLLTVLSGYKAIHVKAVYSIIIFSTIAVISFILFILLLWGIKYVRQAQQSSKGSDD